MATHPEADGAGRRAARELPAPRPRSVGRRVFIQMTLIAWRGVVAIS